MGSRVNYCPAGVELPRNLQKGKVMRLKKNTVLFLVALLAAFLTVPCFAAKDQALKFGIVSIQQAFDNSAVGKSARKVLEAKQSELQPKLLAEKKALEQEGKDIEKKISLWSPKKIQKTELEYRKKMQAYQVKVKDFQATMNQLKIDVLDPIYKRLHRIIDELAKKEGFSMIFAKSSAGLLFANEGLDITDKVLKKLDEETPVK